MNKNIGILGCGWLGLPLARALIKDHYMVRGSTTTAKKMGTLLEDGIEPFLISLSENGISGDITRFLEGLQTLIINIPPNLRSVKKENYIDKIRNLGSAIQNTSLKNIVFISSTSVYGSLQGYITEDTPPRPDTESGHQLLVAEGIIKDLTTLNTVIIRFGGLIGPDRHPINHITGRKDLPTGAEKINLIHLNDCIGWIKTILDTNHWNITINGVYPLHPTKKEYYTLEAMKRGLPPPTYLSLPSREEHKIVGNNDDISKIYQYKTTIIS